MGLGSITLPRRLRIAAVVLIVAWFFLPGLQAWIPLWIPFFVYAALELNFLIMGLREPHVPTTRGRIPQTKDIDELGGEGWLAPMLVRIEGKTSGSPPGGKSDEEVEELIEESRERLLQGESAHSLWPQPPVAPIPRSQRLLARLEGVAVVAALAFVLFVLVPDRGWSGLDKADQAKTEALLSVRGGTDRRARGGRSLRRQRGRGRRRPARRRNRGGRRQERLPDARHLLPALPAQVQGRRGRVQPDRARDRRSRARGVAPPRRDGRGGSPTVTASRAALRSAGGWVCRKGRRLG